MMCLAAFLTTASAFAAADGGPPRAGLLARHLRELKETRAAKQDFQAIVRDHSDLASHWKSAKRRNRVGLWKTLRALQAVGAVTLGALGSPLVTTAIYALGASGAHLLSTSSQRKANTETLRFALRRRGDYGLSPEQMRRWAAHGIVERASNQEAEAERATE
jgi:hypothetical protein